MSPEEREKLAAAVAKHGAFPMPAGSEPKVSDRDRLRAAFVEALGNAHRTHPCPVSGPYWTACVHYDDAGRIRVGSCHSGRRADAVLAVRDAELASERERFKAGLRRADVVNNELMAEVQRYAEGSERPVLWSVYNAMHGRYLAEVSEVNRLKAALSDAAGQVAALESDLGGAFSRLADAVATVARLEQKRVQLERIANAERARVAELEAERHVTNGALDDAVQALRARESGGAARSADKLTRLLAPSQTLREDDDPCLPCGCPKRFNRHADGCPTLFAEAKNTDRIVAFRAPVTGHLYCTPCCTGHDTALYAALTSLDLPDGGVCVGCDTDVLIGGGV